MNENWWVGVGPHLQMTQEKWDRLPDDYKEIKPDGTKVALHFSPGHGTSLGVAEIVDERK